jgi:hypothetical protein
LLCVALGASSEGIASATSIIPRGLLISREFYGPFSADFPKMRAIRRIRRLRARGPFAFEYASIGSLSGSRSKGTQGMSSGISLNSAISGKVASLFIIRSPVFSVMLGELIRSHPRGLSDCSSGAGGLFGLLPEYRLEGGPARGKRRRKTWNDPCGRSARIR